MHVFHIQRVFKEYSRSIRTFHMSSKEYSMTLLDMWCYSFDCFVIIETFAACYYWFDIRWTICW